MAETTGSKSSENLWSRIAGSAVIAVPAIVGLFKWQGYEVSSDQIMELLNNVVLALGAISGAYSVSRGIAKSKR